MRIDIQSQFVTNVTSSKADNNAFKDITHEITFALEGVQVYIKGKVESSC